MIHDPVLAAIGTGGETRVTYSIDHLIRVLIEHATRCIFCPGSWVHGIRARQLELTQAVVPIVGPGGAVDYELLAC